MEDQKVFNVVNTVSLATQYTAGNTLAYLPTTDLKSV